MNSPGARPLTIALIGNPNTGKSTLFNALAGLHSQVGNYPGVTVEKKLGRVTWDGVPLTLVDLPGTYSLSPRSPDERISIDVLLGRQQDVGQVDAIVCVVDASNLERNLYLACQLLSLGRPLVLVLNMIDVAHTHGVEIDSRQLEERLGVPVVETRGHQRVGLDALRAAVLRATKQSPPPRPEIFPPEFAEVVRRLGPSLSEPAPECLVERLLIDVGGQLEQDLVPESARGELERARSELSAAGCKLPSAEARLRYQWIRRQVDGVLKRPAVRPTTWSDKLDHLLTHRLVGLLVFAIVMLAVFQVLYSWSSPLRDVVTAGQEWLAGRVTAAVAPGPLRSLLVDGVVAGVGGVLGFLPQIVLLFLFLGALEDCGYMSRVAFLMDRLMTRVGLSGKSFVPLMSSFACAVPGVMATRVIEDRRDRMVTILVAPLMSCSARLPVYVLMIEAFVPNRALFGGVTLRPLTLLAFYSLGLVVAIPVAWCLKRWVFRGDPAPLVMELPDYKWPTPRIVARRAYEQGKAFVVRAGTLIFATTILVWAAGYFPGDHSRQHAIESRLEELDALDAARPADSDLAADTASPEEQERSAEREQLEAEHRRESASLIAGSLLGRSGRAVEPVVAPLGWDWRIGVGVIASFPAREVVIATLGTIYSLGGDVDEHDEGLRGALFAAKWPDGRPVFGLPVALSLMVFFALCAQCAATLMVIKRETNSWRWPLFTFVYMTSLAYLGALLTFQVASWMG